MSPEQSAAFELITGHYLYMLVSLFIFLLIKGYMSDLVLGIIHRLSQYIKEDDIVMYKGREARVVKMGIMNTTLYMFDHGTRFTIMNKDLKDLERKLPKRNGNGAH